MYDQIQQADVVVWEIFKDILYLRVKRYQPFFDQLCGHGGC